MKLYEKTAAKPTGIYCSNILPVLVITIYLQNVATHRPCVNDGWAAHRSRGWSCTVAMWQLHSKISAQYHHIIFFPSLWSFQQLT